jgi:hypothetical protein
MKPVSKPLPQSTAKVADGSKASAAEMSASPNLALAAGTDKHLVHVANAHL